MKEGVGVGGSVTQLEAGLFGARYQLTRAGTYQLAVLHASLPIDGSLPVVVEPGPTHPRVRLHCMRLRRRPAAAGRRSSFVLVARDFFHNLRLVGGDESAQGSAPTPARRLSAVDDHADARTQSRTRRRGGQLPGDGDGARGACARLAVRAAHQPVVHPRPPMRGLRDATRACGQWERFVVQARDDHGAARVLGGDVLACEIVPGPGVRTSRGPTTKASTTTAAAEQLAQAELLELASPRHRDRCTRPAGGDLAWSRAALRAACLCAACLPVPPASPCACLAMPPPARPPPCDMPLSPPSHRCVVLERAGTGRHRVQTIGRYKLRVYARDRGPQAAAAHRRRAVLAHRLRRAHARALVCALARSPASESCRAPLLVCPSRSRSRRATTLTSGAASAVTRSS